MKKKLVSLMLVAMMAISSLTGCSSVSAESLIDNAFADVKYAEYEMNMSIQMGMDYEGLTMDMGLVLNADIEASETAAHTTMSMDMDAMGMEMSEETETYSVIDKDTMITYTYDADYDEWFYAESDVDDDENMLPQFESDMFEDLEMEKTDDGYVVTGLLTEVGEVLSGTDDETTKELVDALEDVDIEATLTFDKDQKLEEINIVFAVDEDETYDIDGAEVTISEMEVTIEFKELEEDGEVEIPREVEEDAISEDDYYEDDYYDDYEEDDYYEEESEYSGEELAPIGDITGTNAPTLNNITFSINGAEYALGGFTLDDMKSLGFEIDDYDYTEGDEYYINSGDYEYISLYDENICSMYIYFKNNTDGALDILDCDIAGIDFDQSYELEYEGGAHCDFSIMGIPVGTSYTDAEAILGTPSDYYTYDDEITFYYYLDDNYDAQLVLEFDAVYGLTGFDVHSSLYDY